MLVFGGVHILTALVRQMVPFFGGVDFCCFFTCKGCKKDEDPPVFLWWCLWRHEPIAKPDGIYFQNEVGKKRIQPWDSVPFFTTIWRIFLDVFFPTTEQAKSKLMPTGISRGLYCQLLDLLQKCTRENNFVKRWAQPTPTWSLAAQASKSDRIPIGK